MTKEFLVQAPIEAVWHAWTTEEGLGFVSGKSNVDLDVGGRYEWFLDLEPDEQGRRGSEGSKVLAWSPKKMIAFSWTFPPDVPELRYAGEMTQVVVLYDEQDDGKVRVQLNMDDWQDGEAWDRGWEYFDRAWCLVLERLNGVFDDSSRIELGRRHNPTNPSSQRGV